VENKQIDRNYSGGTKVSKQVQSTPIVDCKVDGIFGLDSVLDQKRNVLWQLCNNRQ
jgi:hypothetical protein